MCIQTHATLSSTTNNISKALHKRQRDKRGGRRERKLVGTSFNHKGELNGGGSVVGHAQHCPIGIWCATKQHTMPVLFLYLHTDTLFLREKSMGGEIKNKTRTKSSTRWTIKNLKQNIKLIFGVVALWQGKINPNKHLRLVPDLIKNHFTEKDFGEKFRLPRNPIGSESC